jgi:acyl-CoA thioesterase FadM
MKKEKDRVYIEKPDGHYCFACGTANPIGLNLQFYRKDNAIYTEITLGKVYEGWEGVAHGGIISTLMDEVMSWAIMYAKKAFLVTRKMNSKYVRNVMIGTPLIVSGRMTDDSEPPKVRAKAEIRDEAGRLLVRGTAEFVTISRDALSTVTGRMQEEMLALFERFEG